MSRTHTNIYLTFSHLRLVIFGLRDLWPVVDFIVEECRSRRNNSYLGGSVLLNEGSGVHSNIRQPIRHFVVCAIVMSPAGDTDIISNYSGLSK